VAEPIEEAILVDANLLLWAHHQQMPGTRRPAHGGPTR